MDWESKVSRIPITAPDRKFTLQIFDNPLGMEVLRSVFEGKAYPIVEFIQNVKTVLDIGANIGAASIFFALRYPQARVLSCEPCPATFDLLKQNVAPFPQIQSFNFGLFDRDCEALLHLGNVDGVTNSVGESCLNGQRSVIIRLNNIREFLGNQSIGEIDILKIDTEGCEIPILEALVGWLDRVRVIYVEYHEEADRLALDALLRDTHILTSGKAHTPHRGELCFVNYGSFPSQAEIDKLRIRSDLVRRVGRSGE